MSLPPLPRIARAVVLGVWHHLTQRSNNPEVVFFVDDDRRAYLAMLKQRSVAHGLKTIGYCLTTNHVHMIAVPATEDALAKAVGHTHYSYTQYVSRFHGRCGHLCQNRFHFCLMDEVSWPIAVSTACLPQHPPPARLGP